MNNKEKNRPFVSLGFTDEKVPEGTHMCLIFTKEEERKDSLLKYLLSGLKGGERTACFSGKVTEDELRDYFSENGISYDERKDHNAIKLSGTSEVYFDEGTFDPDRMIDLLTTYYDEAIEMDFPAARVIGEMSPEVEKVPGGDRLLEYEAKVSILQEDHPVTAVCQYDANVFDGATIMNVLKIHPQMIVNGMVVQNPFFIDPHDFLKSC